MKKTAIIIIVILFLALILFLFPKKVGYGGGYEKFAEVHYSESWKCLGFTYRIQPTNCLDCGYGDYCVGIKYGKECKETKWDPNSNETEIISSECRYKPRNIAEGIKLYFNTFDLF